MTEYEKKSHHLLSPIPPTYEALAAALRHLFSKFLIFCIGISLTYWFPSQVVRVSLSWIPTSGWIWKSNGKSVSLSALVLPGVYKCMMNSLTINVLTPQCLTLASCCSCFPSLMLSKWGLLILIWTRAKSAGMLQILWIFMIAEGFGYSG